MVVVYLLTNRVAEVNFLRFLKTVSYLLMKLITRVEL